MLILMVDPLPFLDGHTTSFGLILPRVISLMPWIRMLLYPFCQRKGESQTPLIFTTLLSQFFSQAWCLISFHWFWLVIQLYTPRVTSTGPPVGRHCSFAPLPFEALVRPHNNQGMSGMPWTWHTKTQVVGKLRNGRDLAGTHFWLLLIT